MRFHIFASALISTSASARCKDARSLAKLFQQFVSPGEKPLKRLVGRCSLLHRAEAAVLMRIGATLFAIICPNRRNSRRIFTADFTDDTDRKLESASSAVILNLVAALPLFDIRRLSNLFAPLAVLLSFVFSLSAQTLPDQTLAKIRFEQKLNEQVSASLSFRDENGKEASLGQYFGGKPIVLVLGYYQCPMLCTLVLNGLVESAEDMRWSIGPDFEVLDVSINPDETPALAAQKKRTYLKRYGRSGAAEGWHFLTGNQRVIEQLVNEVGFQYAYDPVSKQYAHPSGLIVLTPKGKVSGYLFGVIFPPKDLYGALQRASIEQVAASPIQQLILLCFHYNPLTGKYSGSILGILRLLSVLTLAGLLGLILLLLRRGAALKRTLGNPLPLPAAECESLTTKHPPAS